MIPTVFQTLRLLTLSWYRNLQPGNVTVWFARVQREVEVQVLLSRH